MREFYRIHPSPDVSSLYRLVESAGLDSDLVSALDDAVVSHIDVDPGGKTWHIRLESSPCRGTHTHQHDPSLIRRLERELSQKIDAVENIILDFPEERSSTDDSFHTEHVTSVSSSAREEAAAAIESPFAAAVSTEVASPSEGEDDSDDYMAMILQRAKEWSQMTEAESKGNGKTGGSKAPSAGEVIMGRRITEEPIPIREVVDEERKVVVEGEVIAFDVREMRSGRKLVTFDITDKTDSLSVKNFESEDVLASQIQVGQYLRLRGPTQFDKFTGELTLLPRDCMRAAPPPERMDTAEVTRVELHLHTKMSALDGAAEIDEVIKLAAKWNHPAIAITDHGVVQAFPDAYAAAKKAGIKLIFGVEGYLIDSPDQKSRPYHIVLLAENPKGLVNLYKLISLSHLEYFYRNPRIPREVLDAHREGIIVGSACEAGELYQAILQGEPEDAVEKIARYYDYLEIQPLANNLFLVDDGKVNSAEDLKNINRRIVELGERLNKPVIATGDVHFLKPDDEIFRQIIMAGHGFDVEQATPLYLRTTDEMLEEFSYLGEEKAYEVVVERPRELADRVEEMAPVPDGFHPPHLEGAEETIKRMALEQAEALYGPNLPPLIEERLEKELSSIIDNGFASLYLIAQKLVQRSLDDGYLVGSRGSVGSSLVATLCGITEVNPLPPHYICPRCHHFEVFEDGSVGTGVDLPHKDCPHCQSPLNRDGFDIPFETFLGFHGDKVPDIDLNFSGEYQPQAHKFAEELFGADKIFRAGTIAKLADRTAYGYVRNFLDSKGVQARSAEINRLVRGCAGVRRTTGQHPGGLMVVPEGREIFEFTPIQYPANDRDSGVTTTHFDYEAIHDNLVKLDILGHDDPTMLRMLEDLTGVDVRKVPIDDPETLKLFSGLESLGISERDASGKVGTLAVPEFGTRFVRQMLVETRPTTVGELVRISGLSHGTNVWTGNAQELIAKGTCTLKDVIATRDDILTYLIRKGLEPGDAFRISEKVRRGRGVSEEDAALMRQHSVPQWYIESCQMISYLFPKAHAAAYVMMALRIAYFKVHHPLQFYAAYFSLRAGEFDANMVLKGAKACRQEVERLEAKGHEATAREKSTVTVLEIVLEAMGRGIRFLPVDLYRSDASRFKEEDGALRCPLQSLQGVGASAARAIAEGRKERPFTSVEDMQRRTKVSKTVVDVLTNHGALKDLPTSDQIALFEGF